ncbi:MAG: hypothetical protein RSB35_08015 [Eubacterium sp.]
MQKRAPTGANLGGTADINKELRPYGDGALCFLPWKKIKGD